MQGSQGLLSPVLSLWAWVLPIFIDHYNRHRAHRGMKLFPSDRGTTAVTPPTTLRTVAAVKRRDRLGGLETQDLHHSAALVAALPRCVLSGRCSCAADGCGGFGIDHVDRSARGVGKDLIKNVRELQVVFVTRDVSDMRRADDIGHAEQRVARIG